MCVRIPKLTIPLVQYSPKACFVFDEDNAIRKTCVWIINHWMFDVVILTLIVVNSLFLAMQDYSKIDNEGEFITENCWRNAVGANAGLFFTIAFTVEMLLKMVGMGIIMDRGTYLRDAWNWLDCIVVISAWLEYIPGLPNLGPLRVLRVLRPLKSVDKMPGLKKIVNSLLASIPKLAPVLAFLFFLFFIFGILGMQFWAGVQHNRCRITDYPIFLPPDDFGWPLGEDFVEATKVNMVRHKRCLELRGCSGDEFKPSNPDYTTCWGCPMTDGNTANGEYCSLNYANTPETTTHFQRKHDPISYGKTPSWDHSFFNVQPYGKNSSGVINKPPNLLVINKEDWTHDSSGWRGAKQCVWPLDEDPAKERICSKGLAPGGVFKDCGTWSHPESDVNKTYRSTCGSNYDDVGNKRFIGHRLMNGPTHVDGLLWGFLNFDEFGSAFLTIFQCVTMEGWTDVMYQLQDSWGGLITALYFVFLILFGSFFVLNLMLAVIWEQFEEMKEKDLEAQEMLKAAEELERAALERTFRSENPGAQVPKSMLSEAEAAERDTEEATAAAAAEASSPTEPTPVADHWKGSPMRNSAYALATNNYFELFITVCILLNTLTLAMDKYPMECEVNDNLEIINFMLTVIFTIETVVKIYGLGPNAWRKDSFNIFDGFIVFVSLIELSVGQPSFITGIVADPNASSGALSALRTFRLFRIFKLARSWTELQKLLVAMLKCVAEIGNFSVLLFLFMFIYALVGRQFFAFKFRFDDNGYVINRFEKYHQDDGMHPLQGQTRTTENPNWLMAESPRANFDTLLWSFVTIFQILTGENWNTVMYDGWRATGWAAVVYFVSLIVFGAFIVLNLFLAILLGGFDSGADADDEAPPEKPKPTVASNRVAPVPSPTGGEDGETSPKSGSEVLGPESPMSGEELEIEAPSMALKMPHDRSLFLFGDKNPFRLLCFKIASHPKFDNTILVLIIISSVLMAADNPLWNPNSPQNKAFWVMDVIFTIVFTCELLVKVIALGFIMHDGSYMRSGWNNLDFVIVIVSIVALDNRYNPSLTLGASGNPAVQSLRSLRTLRALRPLRMISRNPGLKLVVNALVASIPNILNVVMVVILFFLIFAIVGVNYFKGRFMHCAVNGDALGKNDPMYQMIAYPPMNDYNASTFPSTYPYWEMSNDAVHRMAICPRTSATRSDLMCKKLVAGIEPQWTSKQACACLRICNPLDMNMAGLPCVESAEWEASVSQNFNNAIAGILALFEMSTTEQWVDVMYAGVDATGIDMQPIVNYGEPWVLFFVAFMIVGSFFMMQLFVGVVIDNFIVLKEKLGGQGLFLTDAQQDWVKMQEIMLSITPAPVELKPKAKYCFPERLRVQCFDLYKRDWFEPAIMGCIILNTLIMAITYFGEGDTYSLFIEVMNYIFAFIFTVECVVKLLALGDLYFNDSWNVFDFVIVLGTNIGILLKYGAGIDVGSVATIVRTFRVGRIFRLINAAPTLKRTFNTLIITLPSLVNIGALLFLLMFIYAILGVQWYAKVRYGENIKDNANFQDFWTAMLLLVRCSTGENWNGLMYDAMMSDDCVTDPEWSENVCDFVGSDPENCVPINGASHLLRASIAEPLSLTPSFRVSFLQAVVRRLRTSTSLASRTL
jgi:hypothetical protein